MPRHRACETARSRAQSCALALVALAGAGAVRGQTPAVAGEILPKVQARLASLTNAQSPVLRGEAALLLGTLGCSAHETAIRAVADDRDSRAQVRALLGLARLAPAGAEVALGERLEELAPDDPRRHAAAYGLGALPDDHPTPQIDAYAERNMGGNYRRERDTIAALLGGLATSPHPSRRRVCHNVLADASMRDDGVRALAVVVLARSSGEIFPRGFDDALRDTGPLERHALIDVSRMSHGTIAGDTLRRVQRLAAHDSDAEVRAAAIELLLSAARPEVVDLAERALASANPREAGVAVETLLTLGGATRRERVARHIVKADDPERCAAMLDAWRGPAPEALVEAAATSAADARLLPSLRLSAARLLARVDDPRALDALRALAERATASEELAETYRTLIALGHGEEVVAGVERAAKDTDARLLLAARIGALVRAGHPSAPDLLAAVLEEEELEEATLTEVLIAWRRAVQPKVSDLEIAALPAELIEIVR